MNFLLVYAHPNPASFNHALLEATKSVLEAKGHNVRVHDLYKLGFNPVLSGEDFEAMAKGAPRDDVKALQDDISWADRLFFTYPIWWYARPAILQGYIDRVFSHGFAYRGGKEGAPGLLPHDKALVFQTTGLPASTYTGEGDTTIHYGMNIGTLQFCGVKDVTTHTFYGVPAAGDTGRQHMLDEAITIIDNFAA